MTRRNQPAFDPGQSRPSAGPPKPTSTPPIVNITPEFFQAVLKLQPSGVAAPILIIQAMGEMTEQMVTAGQALGKYLKVLGITPIIVSRDWMVEEGTDEMMLGLGWQRAPAAVPPMPAVPRCASCGGSGRDQRESTEGDWPYCLGTGESLDLGKEGK